VGGCAAVDLVQMVKKRRKTVNGLRIESSGERREEEPRRFTKIHLRFILNSPDATEEELIKLLKLAVEKYCSVSGSLAADMELTYEGVVER
jgi:putative redox protein